MSRPGAPSARNLTLPEELEKLEQSITLTLQEIDHNFSKAHRIVTTSILPIVEQYGEQSKAVWEASKFWKQFFEASANVSLSGYEELAGEEDTTTASGAEETTALDATEDYSGEPGDTTVTSHAQYDNQGADESILSGDGMTGSTPRPPTTRSLKPQFAAFSSPYESLKRELKGEDHTARTDMGGDDETMELPAHGAEGRLPDMSMTPRSSSMLEAPTPLARQESAFLDKSSKGNKTKDPLLHRVLDKNYRLQATPHKNTPSRASPERAADKDQSRRALWQDSPMSSPEMAVPKLRSDLYQMSPVRGRGAGPRTPGVSVQTPTTAKKRDIFAGEGDKGKGAAKRDYDEINWDSDEEDATGGKLFGGMSPPKTIQFALPPSKLMQTPAREASKRIVDDILLTAGVGPEGSSEYSPTMVKMNENILDDTF